MSYTGEYEHRHSANGQAGECFDLTETTSSWIIPIPRKILKLFIQKGTFCTQIEQENSLL